jgi:hypothetical protein
MHHQPIRINQSSIFVHEAAHPIRDNIFIRIPEIRRGVVVVFPDMADRRGKLEQSPMDLTTQPKAY